MTVICATIDICFDIYTSCEGEFVFMSNNVESKCIGIGMVKIKMFVGIVRTLMHVMHFPDLRRKLISLGALDSKGCKCNIASGDMNVIKGALVIEKGGMIKSLYRLARSTVTAGGGATTRKKKTSVEVELNGKQKSVQ